MRQDRHNAGKPSAFAALVLCLTLAACSTGRGSLDHAGSVRTIPPTVTLHSIPPRLDPHPPAVAEVEPDFVEEGIASWYGPGFVGRLTANGEIFDPEAMTAAHPELPFGVRALVVNLENGRRVSVRINDRGPFIGERIIDLSHAAARRLGFVHDGLAQVRVEVHEMPSDGSA